MKYTGRFRGQLVDTYRCDDAQILLVTLGSVSSTARVAVDEARDKGVKVGLARIRVLRPFPAADLASLIQGREAVGVIDRNVCFGWGTGIVYLELMAALAGLRPLPRCVDFIDGLGGCDITLGHLAKAIAISCTAAAGEKVNRVNWLTME